MDNRSNIHITNNFNAPIGQHIDHVDVINFRMDGDGTFHFGKVEEVNHEATDSRNDKAAEFDSDDARRYWRELQQKGFVDEDCQLMPATTRKQAMYIAELFAEKLRLKSKWKSFQSLWNLNNLAQEKWSMQQTGSMPSRYKEIERIFEG